MLETKCVGENFEILATVLAVLLRHTIKMRTTPACNPGVCSGSAGLIHEHARGLLFSNAWRYIAGLQKLSYLDCDDVELYKLHIRNPQTILNPMVFIRSQCERIVIS